MTSTPAIPDDDYSWTVPVVEEALEVDTVVSDRGGYRLTKEVSTRQEIVEQLAHLHHVEIERRPIGRELDGDEVPEPHYEGDTLIVPVVEEILVTQKRLLLIEEIRITRKRTATRQSRSFTLHKEEIQIERLEADSSDRGPSEPQPIKG